MESYLVTQPRVYWIHCILVIQAGEWIPSNTLTPACMHSHWAWFDGSFWPAENSRFGDWILVLDWIFQCCTLINILGIQLYLFRSQYTKYAWCDPVIAWSIFQAYTTFPFRWLVLSAYGVQHPLQTIPRFSPGGGVQSTSREPHSASISNSQNFIWYQYQVYQSFSVSTPAMPRHAVQQVFITKEIEFRLVRNCLSSLSALDRINPRSLSNIFRLAANPISRLCSYYL